MLRALKWGVGASALSGVIGIPVVPQIDRVIEINQQAIQDIYQSLADIDADEHACIMSESGEGWGRHPRMRMKLYESKTTLERRNLGLYYGSWILFPLNRHWSAMSKNFASSSNSVSGIPPKM